MLSRDIGTNRNDVVSTWIIYLIAVNNSGQVMSTEDHTMKRCIVHSALNDASAFLAVERTALFNLGAVPFYSCSSLWRYAQVFLCVHDR